MSQKKDISGFLACLLIYYAVILTMLCDTSTINEGKFKLNIDFKEAEKKNLLKTSTRQIYTSVGIFNVPKKVRGGQKLPHLIICILFGDLWCIPTKLISLPFISGFPNVLIQCRDMWDPGWAPGKSEKVQPWKYTTLKSVEL